MSFGKPTVYIYICCSVSWSCGDLTQGRKKLEETFYLSVDDENFEKYRKSSTLDLFGTLNR